MILNIIILIKNLTQIISSNQNNLNMSNNIPSHTTISESTLHTIIFQSAPRTWTGSIFFSNYNSTSEIILLIKSIGTSYQGTFLKNPFFIFKAYSKTEVENQINAQISSLIKQK